MKFIVTGGAGFIGHNVVRELEAQGHSCFIIDSVTNYGFIPKDELAYLKRERRNRMRSSVHHTDLRDHKVVDNFFMTFADRCDAVIHLASFPRQKVVSQHPIWGSEVMSTALVNLLECTRRYHIPRFVYVSSSMVYGDFADGVREDAVCQPQGQYGIMKLMGEHLVRDYARRGCFDHTIIRPSAVYGEYDVEDRVVSKFILSALRGQTLRVNGAGESLDFTHVSDTALGIADACTSKNTRNKIYNITKSQSISLLDAANLAVTIAGSGSVEVRDRDQDFPSRGRLDISAAQTDFGYAPKIDIAQGFEQYCNWFRTSKFWQQKI